MKTVWIFIGTFFFLFEGKAQLFDQKWSSLEVILFEGGVKATIDVPEEVLKEDRALKLILYALPNGNTAAQTFGKRLNAGDDWHFDIQHIGAQTQWIRAYDPASQYVVVYLENSQKSWPAWRRNTLNADQLITRVIDSLYAHYEKYTPEMTLSAHSGGGSLIFGYMRQNQGLHPAIKRLGLLDATYAYETSEDLGLLNSWLQNPHHSLQVFAYNDSTVQYNGKPLVSPTGGTWYRSRRLLHDLKGSLSFEKTTLHAYDYWKGSSPRQAFYLLGNPQKAILHTKMVEMNGFICLVMSGCPGFFPIDYFWKERVYNSYLLR